MLLVITMVIFQKPFVSYITSNEYEMLKIDIQNTIYANKIAIVTCMYIHVLLS